MNRIEAIRRSTGLNRVSFSQKYCIPLTTMEAWENEKRTPPEYVIDLLERAVKADLQAAQAVEDVKHVRIRVEYVTGYSFTDLANDLHIAEDKSYIGYMPDRNPHGLAPEPVKILTNKIKCVTITVE